MRTGLDSEKRWYYRISRAQVHAPRSLAGPVRIDLRRGPGPALGREPPAGPVRPGRLPPAGGEPGRPPPLGRGGAPRRLPRDTLPLGHRAHQGELVPPAPALPELAGPVLGRRGAGRGPAGAAAGLASGR